VNFAPEKSDLKATFKWLSEQSYRGVQGVYVYDSGTAGLTFGVTVHTHGNEPCGLAALGVFQQLISKGTVFKGRIIFTLNNIEASKKYWLPENDPAEFKYRFLDTNMNRVPEEFNLEGQVYEEYEFKRIQELRKIWKEFDVAVDFHTTSQDAPAMVIANDTLPLVYVSALPISHYLEGMERAVKSNFLTKLYGHKSSTDMYMIECGQHEDLSAFKCAAECFLSLIQSYRLTENVYELSSDEELQVYKVTESCFFPDASYEQIEIYKNFAAMKAGQVLAEGDGSPVVAPFDGHILMAPSVKKPAYLTEETYFFSKPVISVRRERALSHA
jgi:succinylglutamate desuccinylase